MICICELTLLLFFFSCIYSGRYNIDMYQDFLRLRGKTYDYKIMYSNIIKLFLLLKPDEVHVLFVVSSLKKMGGRGGVLV